MKENKNNNLLNKIFCYLGVEEKGTWVPFFTKWFVLGFVIHLITAIFSTGFYHYDEHFQILEFLGSKLNLSSVSELPWEYHHKMRSWTQPGLYFLIAKSLSVFGIENPITLAFFFRLFSSLTGWLSLCTLGCSVFFLFKEDSKRKWAIILLTLAWYIPFIQTRPSSEGLGANFFILGLSMMIWGLMRQKSQGNYPFLLAFASGIFFGLSFTFRFQLGFIIMFCWFWVVWLGKIPFSRAFSIAFGIVAMILLEVLVDFWGYGTWTFAPWNYLYQNLVLNKASNFPVFPWWAYLLFSFKKGIPPLSLILILSQVMFWIKRPRHILSWATFPLFLIHTIIAAKAMRYMFPIAILTPLTLVELPALLKIESSLKSKWIRKLLHGMLIFNIILLIITSFKPVKSIMGFYDYVYDNKDKIKKIHTKGKDPYNMVGLPIYFYRPENLTITTSPPNKKQYWYFLNNIKGKIDKNNILLIDNVPCQLVYLNYPLFFLKFNIGNWQDNSRIWGLFNCRKKK